MLAYLDVCTDYRCFPQILRERVDFYTPLNCCRLSVQNGEIRDAPFGQALKITLALLSPCVCFI